MGSIRAASLMIPIWAAAFAAGLSHSVHGQFSDCFDFAKELPPSSATTLGFGDQVDVDGDVVIVSLAPSTLRPSTQVYVYRRVSSTWTLQATLTSTGADNGGDLLGSDPLGRDVAVSGNVAVVGAPTRGGDWCTDQGVYVFRYDATRAMWSQEAILEPPQDDPYVTCGFGFMVAIEGDTIIVEGGYYYYLDGFTRATAFPFKYDPAARRWIAMPIVPISKPANYYWRPASHLYFSGNRFIGSNPGSDNPADFFARGSAYIYRLDGDTPIKEAQLESPSDDDVELFGYADAIEDGVAVVSAVRALVNGERRGVVYVYCLMSGTWILEQTIPAPDEFDAANFGVALQPAGSTLLVAGSADSSVGWGTGVVYRYVRDVDTGIWSLRGVIQPPTASRSFGWTMSGSGDHLVVGDRLDDEAGIDAGAVYIASGLADVGGNGSPDACDLARGDNNLDGVVNVTDLIALLSAWGPCLGDCPADSNFDDVVNVTDLLTLLANWD